MYGFFDHSAGGTFGATDADGTLRQTIMAFDDVADRDAQLAAVLEEGLVTQTLDDDTFWKYNGSDWEILFEREKAWTGTSITQPTAVAHTVNWGSYRRSYGRWDATLKVTFSAAGSAGNAIGIATPFDVVSASGTFTFLDDTLGQYRQGGVLGVADDTMALVIDLSDDLYGISGADGITSGDVLWLDVHGSY